MKWETDIVSNSTSLMMDESLRSTIWTPVENKLFENALAKFDNDTPDRWQRVAEMVPGKTVADVIRQYKELEDDSKSPAYASGGMRSPLLAGAAGVTSSRPLEQERKKGVPWTEEEHKLFLLGLKKYGKGDWRNISRNYVVTRTPTQVASHAQKYFIRQLSGGKDKRRASIHDITTVNVNESQLSSPKNRRTSPEQCKFQWNQPGSASAGFQQTNGNNFTSSQYIGNVGFRTGGSGGGGGLNEFYGVPDRMVFRMQPAMHYPYG
ncbi:putative transcription factor MYB/SANT family [Helianthus debilis subsp. tardiflorus]